MCVRGARAEPRPSTVRLFGISRKREREMGGEGGKRERFSRAHRTMRVQAEIVYVCAYKKTCQAKAIRDGAKSPSPLHLFSSRARPRSLSPALASLRLRGYMATSKAFLGFNISFCRLL